MHQAMAAALDDVIAQIKAIQKAARDCHKEGGNIPRPCWPMIVRVSPKGWTGPKLVDGQQIEGSFRAHQIPLNPIKNYRRVCKELPSDWPGFEATLHIESSLYRVVVKQRLSEDKQLISSATLDGTDVTFQDQVVRVALDGQVHDLVIHFS
jgi:hypothetical protein